MQRTLVPVVSAVLLWASSLGAPARAQVTFSVEVELTAEPEKAAEGDSADAKPDTKDDAKSDAKDTAPFKDEVPGESEDRGFFEVHHWGVWMADPASTRSTPANNF